VRSQQKVIYCESQEDHLDHEDAGELEDVGVPSLQILFENGKYEFPYGEECRNEIDTLLQEVNGMA